MDKVPLWMPTIITLAGWFGLHQPPAYVFGDVRNLIIYVAVAFAWIAWFTNYW